MSPHPPRAQLEALSGGALEEADVAAVQAHLQDCPSCRAIFTELTAEHEALARQLRAAAASPAQALDARFKPDGVQASGLQPDAFPGYELGAEIHRGGQGVVYCAVQRSTKRNVAIKVMKDGPFASRRDQARFEREVEVLAQLKHPGIVAIHDSGRARGHFYFVMDYITGESLDRWAERAQRPVPELLQLFAGICAAVSAAHLRGIMHRDLKPGNILVDEAGHPHILDFGLAKWSESPESSLATVTGQFMGSLPWASPEQAEGVPGGVDVRTDVYSLGVILYRLLTGRFPYEVVGSMRDVLDRIVGTEPARPRSLNAEIGDELETIVLKCLAKEPARRYQSAGELARDVHHLMAGEPIEAKRDSTLYMLRKSLHRHRISAAVTAAFLGLVFTASIALLVVWRQAVRDRDRAREAEQTAVDEKAKAEDESYIGLIGLAAKRAEESKWTQAKEALVACPPRCRNWEWGHLAFQCYEDVQVFACAPDPHLLLYTPDGRHLIAPAAANAIQLLDARTGETTATLSGHTATIRCGAVARGAAGEALLVTGGDDRTVRVWDLATGECRQVLTGFAHEVRAVAFSPDARAVAVGLGAEGATQSAVPTVSLWDWSTAEQRLTLDAHACTRALAFTPDGKRLVTGGSEHCARLWDLRSRQCVRTFDGFTSDVLGVAVSRDGTRLVTVCRPSPPDYEDGDALWDLTQDQQHPLRLSVHTGGSACAAFSADGSRLATGGVDTNVAVIAARAGWLEEVLEGHQQMLSALAFSPSGQKLASAAADGTIRVWGLTGRSAFIRLDLDDRSGKALAYSPDGRRLAIVTQGDLPERRDTVVSVWDPLAGRAALVLSGLKRPTLALAYAPDGRCLVTGTEDGAVCFWDAESGTSRSSFACSDRAVKIIAFRQDGGELAVGSADGRVRLCDPQSGAVRGELSAPVSAGRCPVRIQYSPLGEHIAVAYESEDGGEARIWRAGAPEAAHALAGYNDSVAFSPDGRWLAASNRSGECVILDVGSGRQVKKLAGGGGQSSLAFSRDGSRLAAAVGATVRFYDCKTWRELASLGTVSGGQLEFSPDGTTLATCGSGYTALVWPTFPWNEEAYAASGSWDERLAAFAREYWEDFARYNGPREASTAESMQSWLGSGHSRNTATRLQLRPGGLLNGQPVGPGQSTVEVAAGGLLTGAVLIRTSVQRGAGGIMPVAATVTWGDREKVLWPIELTLPRGAWHELTVFVRRTAPLTPGVYHLVVACCGEKTSEEVLASTNWTYAEAHNGVVWHDHNDVGFDWTPQQFWEAQAYGCTAATILAGGLHPQYSPSVIGATWVRVIVTAPVATHNPA